MNEVSVLQKLVDSYNSTVHSTTGCEPKRVNKYNEMDVWLRSFKDLYNLPCKPAKLKIYNRVRIVKKKGIFEKGYSPTYTKEVFEVAEVINSIPITYKIRDMTGYVLSGIFYEQELSQVLV